jgi:hypothetical protein
VFLIHPNNINVIHSGSASVSVSVKCLVLVKMYGNKPRKLFIRIMRNNEVKIYFLVFLLFSLHISLRTDSINAEVFKTERLNKTSNPLLNIKSINYVYGVE